MRDTVGWLFPSPDTPEGEDRIIWAMGVFLAAAPFIWFHLVTNLQESLRNP